MAWYLHFREIARRVTRAGDILHVAVATGGTNAKKQAFHVDEVCARHAPAGCTVVVAHWRSATSWGLQVADYALWAVQRDLLTLHGRDPPNAGNLLPALGPGMIKADYPGFTGRGLWTSCRQPLGTIPASRASRHPAQASKPSASL